MNILLIDDEEDVRASLSRFITKLGHAVSCAKDGLEGWQMFCVSDVDLVITDIRMPRIDGLELLHKIKQVRRSPALVIVITGHGDMKNAIKALKFGAYDYLQKPIDVRELAITIERAIDYVTLRNNYKQLKNDFKKEVAEGIESCRCEVEHFREAFLQEVGLGEIQIFSEAMRRVIEKAEKYSQDRSVPVLIQGESGTGKELIVKLIHYYGLPKPNTPFVAINCGAISHALFEGELFGHEAGAFTGATAKGRMGKIEAAEGGTLFLDEIGEMPLDMQVKLLRVLEEQKFYRVGGVKEVPVDIRVIAATNKDLGQEVAAGRFRLDLLHRVNMGFISIPALRERENAIIPLAVHFISRAYARRGKRFEGFSAQTESVLSAFSWPGNVRQLKNAMERLAILTTNLAIEAEDIDFLSDESVPEPAVEVPGEIPKLDALELPAGRFDLEALNFRIIRKALEMNDDNKTRKAEYLGMSRRVLQGRLKKMGL